MNISWKRWALQACAHIRFKPDRGPVEEELLAHLEDRAEALCQSGMGLERAEKQALASMGDADEVGRQLAAVHRPLLGWLWMVSRWALILCVAVTLWLALGVTARYRFSGEENVRYWQERSWYTDRASSETWTELAPDCAGDSGIYTFTVPAAAYWRDDGSGNSGTYTGEQTMLYFTLRASSGQPRREGCEAFDSFYAVDDLGNFYQSPADEGRAPSGLRCVRGNSSGVDLWTTDYHAWIEYLDPSASWVELRYDREGRDVRLRIDLTGGEDT